MQLSAATSVSTCFVVHVLQILFRINSIGLRNSQHAIWCSSFLTGQTCDGGGYALGMESRTISDYQITTSSYARTTTGSYPPHNARLNYADVIGQIQFYACFNQLPAYCTVDILCLNIHVPVHEHVHGRTMHVFSVIFVFLVRVCRCTFFLWWCIALGSELPWWRPFSETAGDWLTVDLLVVHTITRLAIQGEPSSAYHVKTFKLGYSMDALFSWTFLQNEQGDEKVRCSTYIRICGHGRGLSVSGCFGSQRRNQRGRESSGWKIPTLLCNMSTF